MKFNYDRINNNVKALDNRDKHMQITRDIPLGYIEFLAQRYHTSIYEILFGEIKPKYKEIEVTIDGDTKTFYIPIDKFEDFLLDLEEISV